MMWTAVLLTALGCYLLKLGGLSVPPRVLERPLVERVADLIPVAVARTPQEAAPIAGSILGDPGAAELSVHVDVRPVDSLQAAA